LKRVVLIVLASFLLAGCRLGFQKDRNLRALHLFGLGWICVIDGTNVVRVFCIGSLDATRLSSVNQTNAPFVIQEALTNR